MTLLVRLVVWRRLCQCSFTQVVLAYVERHLAKKKSLVLVSVFAPSALSLVTFVRKPPGLMLAVYFVKNRNWLVCAICCRNK